MRPNDSCLPRIEAEGLYPGAAVRRSCPVCASSALRYWGSKFGYDLMKCDVCSHVSVQPQPSLDEISRGYSGVAETPYVPMSSAAYYCHLKGSEAGHVWPVSSLVMDLVAKYSSESTSRQWLDIGAGSGYLVEQARLAGWDAQGIEAGPWGVVAAQERHVPIIQAFFEGHEFGPERFDVISAIDVLEHTGDVRRFVQKCWSLTRAGCLLILALPCSSSPHGWFGFLRRRWSMVWPPAHLHYFSHMSLVHLLKSGGFEPLEFIRYEEGGYKIGKPRFVAELVDKLGRFVVDRVNLGDQILVVARSVTGSGDGSSPRE